MGLRSASVREYSRGMTLYAAGPHSEANEVLGGFYLIETTDLDEPTVGLPDREHGQTDTPMYGSAVITPDEIRALEGADVSVRLVPQAGGEVVVGRLVGTLDADDGLVVVIQPEGGESDRRLSYNYQHIATVQRL